MGELRDSVAGEQKTIASEFTYLVGEKAPDFGLNKGAPNRPDPRHQHRTLFAEGFRGVPVEGLTQEPPQ